MGEKTSPFSHILLHMSEKLLTFWHVRIKERAFQAEAWCDMTQIFWLVLPSGWNNPEVLQALESKLLLTFCWLPLTFALL